MMFAGQWEWFLAFVYSRIPLNLVNFLRLFFFFFLIEETKKTKPGGE